MNTGRTYIMTPEHLFKYLLALLFSTLHDTLNIRFDLSTIIKRVLTPLLDTFSLSSVSLSACSTSHSRIPLAASPVTRKLSYKETSHHTTLPYLTQRIHHSPHYPLARLAHSHHAHLSFSVTLIFARTHHSSQIWWMLTRPSFWQPPLSKSETTSYRLAGSRQSRYRNSGIPLDSIRQLVYLRLSTPSVWFLNVDILLWNAMIGIEVNGFWSREHFKPSVLFWGCKKSFYIKIQRALTRLFKSFIGSDSLVAAFWLLQHQFQVCNTSANTFTICTYYTSSCFVCEMLMWHR